MIQIKKKKFYAVLSGYILSAVIVVALFSGGAFANNDHLDVRGGEHAKYSRIVFDWGKQVQYKSKRSDGVVDIIFSATTSRPKISGVNPDQLEGLKAIKHINVPRDVTYIRLFLPKGGKHRSYRLGKLVVFDLYHPDDLKPQQTVSKQIKAKPRYATIPKSLPQKIPVKTTLSTGAKLPEISKIVKAVTAVVSEKENMEAVAVTKEQAPKINTKQPPIPPAVKIGRVEQKPLLAGYTTITMSTIDPASMAVFERFGSLWMVVDTNLASILPLVAGPFSTVLGKPEMVRLKGGMAYRFNMPKQAEVVDVRFQNLSWIVALKPTAHKTAMMNAGQLRRIIRPNKNPTAEIFLPSIKKIVVLRDSQSGDDLYVVTSKSAGARISLQNRYPEFAMLRAHQGAVVKSFTDDLSVKHYKNKILITTPKGLIMTEDVAELPAADIGKGAQEQLKHAKKGEDVSRLFDFYGWSRGGLDFLWENQRKIEAKIGDAEEGDELSAVYLEMALLYFANGYGHEAIGALRAASMENPALVKNPGFLAVKGGAEALAGFSHRAIEDLSTPGLKDHPEAKMWRGYAAAATEQWTLAGNMFPKLNGIVSRYPPNMAIPFTLYMAESALRLGDTVQARVLLGTLKNMKEDMKSSQKSAEQYLKGEAWRQEGELIKALKAWYPVVNGRDQLYYVKASLATVALLRKIHRLSDADAQDRLETLRYVWRGDGLEIQMLHNIARLYLDKKEYIKGLEEMRRAVSLSEETLHDSSVLMADMEKIFSDLYVTGKFGDLEPFKAVSIYNSFKELLPTGHDSLVAEQNYADYLIEMDLLDEAAKIYERQLKRDLTRPKKIGEVGTRLASIYLLDGKAQMALSVLKRTQNKILGHKLVRKRDLLRARALSEIGLRQQAIKILKTLPSLEAKKLRADIYWKNSEWSAAASILTKIMVTPDVIKSAKNILDSELVLNTAVAYKLAKDQEKLRKLRERYLGAMKGTPHGASFAVVSRFVDGIPSLKDRQTILDMAEEVDLFKGFLDDFKMNKVN